MFVKTIYIFLIFSCTTKGLGFWWKSRGGEEKTAEKDESVQKATKKKPTAMKRRQRRGGDAGTMAGQWPAAHG